MTVFAGTGTHEWFPIDLLIAAIVGGLVILLILYAVPRLRPSRKEPSPEPPPPAAPPEPPPPPEPEAGVIRVTVKSMPPEPAPAAPPAPNGTRSALEERARAERYSETGRRPSSGSGERGGALYFGKAPTSLASSGRVGTGGTERVERTERTERITGRWSNERTDRIDARVPPGKFIPQGPTAEHDFDRWKEKKIVDELQEQNTELTNLLTMLPGFTKRLSETTNKRELAPLLADMVMRLCLPPPEKVMVFFVSRSKNDLVLAAKIGYEMAGGETLASVKVPKHWGRVGYAVKNQLTMDMKDFERDHVDDRPPPGQAWRTEVAAPLIYNKEVLGAISVEGFPSYSKNLKRLIGVSANLGALAISLAEKTAQIQHQANSDALTGLFNKRYFFERLEQEVAVARQTGKPLSLFMFDIDHFKKYNDRNGHQAGDEALKITGQLLNERRRDQDIGARYGGEEFIVILPDTNKEGAYAFGESYRKIVEAHPFPHGEGQPLGKVTISGGVATFPEDGIGPTSLIEAADACLYRSKEHGRNFVTKRAPARDVIA